VSPKDSDVANVIGEVIFEMDAIACCSGKYTVYMSKGVKQCLTWLAGSGINLPTMAVTLASAKMMSMHLWNSHWLRMVW